MFDSNSAIVDIGTSECWHQDYISSEMALAQTRWSLSHMHNRVGEQVCGCLMEERMEGHRLSRLDATLIRRPFPIWGSLHPSHPFLSVDSIAQLSWAHKATD